MNIAYNMDCLEAMKSMPDKAFDLAVVDPPYGGGTQTVQVKRTDCAEVRLILNRENGLGLVSGSTDTISENMTGGVFSSNIDVLRTGGTWAQKYGTNINHWDIAPSKEYFDELARVSKNQIIWGGNYFDLPPTRCFLVWKKLTISENFSMAMCEYAWTSFNDNAKLFECAPQGKAGDKRFHPTQKPIVLYEWIFNRYAKKGDKILDTHLWSGSSRIAAYYAGLDFVGYEIDKEYFDKQEERFAEHTAQMRFTDLI